MCENEDPRAFTKIYFTSTYCKQHKTFYTMTNQNAQEAYSQNKQVPNISITDD